MVLHPFRRCFLVQQELARVDEVSKSVFFYVRAAVNIASVVDHAELAVLREVKLRSFGVCGHSFVMTQFGSPLQTCSPVYFFSQVVFRF